MRYFVPVMLLVSAIGLGQELPVPSEQQFLRFILLNIASSDHDPEAIKAFESHLVKQFALNAHESASIHAAGQALRPLLDQNRRAGRTIAAGKRVLSPGDLAALRDLDSQREQRIAALASQILSDVSPITAVRLTTAGRNLAAGVAKKK
ncbi:MAG: hypothetical protein M1541_16320 [Acidobacteria bacterium]|nr:hypothetical protein [Acidobacteriota bacterium]